MLLYILRLIQIETRTLEEVKEVLAHKGEGLGRVTRIMLDNMVVPLPDGSVDVSMLKQAIELVNGQLETEVPILPKVHVSCMSFYNKELTHEFHIRMDTAWMLVHPLEV